MKGPEGFTEEEWEQLEWEEFVGDEHSDEERNILALVDNGLPFQNFFNTFQWVNDYCLRINNPDQLPGASLMTDGLGIVPGRERLYFWDTARESIQQEQMSVLEAQYGKLDANWTRAPYKDSYYIKSPLENFLDIVSCGQYPPPEILVSVAKCFNLYLQAKGDLSLEEVFFGKPKKRAGNFAAREARYM